MTASNPGYTSSDIQIRIHFYVNKMTETIYTCNKSALGIYTTLPVSHQHDIEIHSIKIQSNKLLKSIKSIKIVTTIDRNMHNSIN